MCIDVDVHVHCCYVDLMQKAETGYPHIMYMHNDIMYMYIYI